VIALLLKNDEHNFGLMSKQLSACDQLVVGLLFIVINDMRCLRMTA